MARLVAFTLGLALFVGAAAPVMAQGEKGKDTELEVVTKLYEAFKRGEWKDAIQAWQLIKERFDGAKKKPLLFLAAQAHYNLKQYDLADSALRTLQDLQEDHVGGLYLRAKIKAKQKKPEQAKDFLLASARAGQFVIRDINSAEGKDIFKALLKDSGFILRVMNASSEFQVSTSGLRNPFRSPLRKVKGDAGAKLDDQPTTIKLKRLRELEKRVDELFSEIAQLAEERNVEELIGKFTDLRQIMAEYGQDGSDAVKKKMAKWQKQLAAFGEVQLSIQLQIYINEGNQHLRAMAEAIKKDEYDKALESFEKIKELKDQMYAEERDVFHRNADALFLRGKSLADRAIRLKRISEFKLIVTGIIVAPPNDEQAKDSAIINDRIYREGDTIIEETSEEEIEGLFVVEISRSTVKFRFQDTPFVRELKTASK